MKTIVKTCRKHGELEEWQTKLEITKKGYKVYRCHLCKIIKDQKWKKNNKEKHRASAGQARAKSRKLYREGKTDIEPKANIWARRAKLLNPEKYKEYSARGRKKAGILRSIKEVTRIHGIKLEQYYGMIGLQNNKCAICNKKETRKNRNGDIARLSIDHCHKTGIVRALLCHGCNTGIGKFKENIFLMKKAIKYLKKHAE